MNSIFAPAEARCQAGLAADPEPKIKVAEEVLRVRQSIFYPAEIYTGKDACKAGKTVAVVRGSSNVSLLKEKCSDAQIKELTGGGPAVAQAVAADQADAGIIGMASAAGYVFDYPDFRVLDGALKKWPLSFATRPDEVHLLRWLDNYFMLIQLDGRLDQLAEYWMWGPAWKADH